MDFRKALLKEKTELARMGLIIVEELRNDKANSQFLYRFSAYKNNEGFLSLKGVVFNYTDDVTEESFEAAISAYYHAFCVACKKKLYPALTAEEVRGLTFPTIEMVEYPNEGVAPNMVSMADIKMALRTHLKYGGADGKLHGLQDAAAALMELIEGERKARAAKPDMVSCVGCLRVIPEPYVIADEDGDQFCPSCIAKTYNSINNDIIDRIKWVLDEYHKNVNDNDEITEELESIIEDYQTEEEEEGGEDDHTE